MSLGRFIVRRFLQAIVVFWASMTIIFSLRNLIPGDVVVMMTNPETPLEVQNQIREELGLNEPLHVQYYEYMSTLLSGDLGYSYYTNIEVEALIFPRLLPTLELAVMATVIAIVFAIPFGVVSAKRRNSKTDLTVTLASLFGVSTPNFWLGLMLILLLGVFIDVFPTARQPIGSDVAVRMLVQEGSFEGIVSWAAHITLPAVTLGTYYMALLTRLTRGGMLDELGQLYITAARAKGLPNVLVEYKYALKNSLIPLITIIAVNIGGLLNGSLVVEAVFNWPGVGQLFLTAIRQRDWPVVQALLILVAGAYVGMNTLADILYTVVDPRVRYD